MLRSCLSSGEDGFISFIEISSKRITLTFQVTENTRMN